MVILPKTLESDNVAIYKHRWWWQTYSRDPALGLYQPPQWLN